VLDQTGLRGKIPYPYRITGYYRSKFPYDHHIKGVDRENHDALKEVGDFPFLAKNMSKKMVFIGDEWYN